jgi:hypothetical protein
MAVAAGLCGVLVSSTLFVPPAMAGPGDKLPAPRDASAAVKRVKAAKAAVPAMPKATSTPVVWPKPGEKTVELPAGANGLRGQAAAVVGGLPLRVAPAPGRDGDTISGRGVAGTGVTAPARVQLEVLDREVATATGTALLVRVARADGVQRSGRARIEVDYSAFRDAFGADWAWRLRLASLPLCAATTPSAPECVHQTELPSSNDGNAGVVSADVPLPAAAAQQADGSAGPSDDGMLLALVAAAESPETADYSKTDLKASSTWSAGGSSGDFNWSYPIETPPVPGGLVPSIALSYSSGAVDGQTAGENTQPGAFGEGWSYTPGYIERTYRPCHDDAENSPKWTALNATSDSSGQSGV